MGTGLHCAPVANLNSTTQQSGAEHCAGSVIVDVAATAATRLAAQRPCAARLLTPRDCAQRIRLFSPVIAARCGSPCNRPGVPCANASLKASSIFSCFLASACIHGISRYLLAVSFVLKFYSATHLPCWRTQRPHDARLLPQHHIRLADREHHILASTSGSTRRWQAIHAPAIRNDAR